MKLIKFASVPVEAEKDSYPKRRSLAIVYAIDFFHLKIVISSLFLSSPRKPVAQKTVI